MLTDEVMKTPPGIGRIESLKLLQKKEGNYVEMYRELKERLGDVFSLHLPTLRYVVNHPDHIRHVLKDHHSNYVKSADYKELKPILGDGLLNSEGDLWKRQRKLISAEFTHEKIRQQGKMMVEAAERVAKKWENQEGVFDIAADMMALAFDIAGNAFFGADLGSNSEIVGGAFADASEASTIRMISLFKLPMAFPTANNRRYKRAIRTLDKIIFETIDHRRHSAEGRHDLLSRLLSASTAEGKPLSSKLLRDELSTFIIAGHETTALALTWTWYLLAQNTRVREKLKQELTQVLSGRSPTVEDLVHLPYNRAVVQESMRLYPPAPAVSRMPLHDDVIGGFKIKAGSLLSCVPAIIHRDARFWKDPDTFDPERFIGENQKHIYPFSYFPFGAGPRICVGESFALIEAQLVMATLVQRFSVRLDEKAKVVPNPLVTLRPKHGLMGTVSAA